MRADLGELLRDWRPEPVETAHPVPRWPIDAFAGVLDVASPLDASDAVPPLWHWFLAPDQPAQHELGADGHPEHGVFLPPIPDRRRMIAGGRLRQWAPLRVGTEVTRRSELAAVDVKRGRSGDMAFVTVRTEFRDAGRVLAVEEQDVVYRQQPAGTARAATAPDPVADRPPGPWRRTQGTDPVLLFRFSALTYNAHRIHYDEPYVTAVEGYPALVVHGPLLALLALELPRVHAARSHVAEFSYRLRRPVFAGTELLADGARDGDTVDLYVGGVELAPSLTATARLEEDR